MGLHKQRYLLLNNEAGMTLIEIMIVIMIIAGLMTVLGNSAMDQFAKAKVKQAEIQMRTIETALKTYSMDCGNFPSEEVGLEALVTAPGADVCPNWGPNPYLKASQLKDPFNHSYVYKNDGSSDEPVIIFLGKDGKVGGTGYNKDISTETTNSPIATR